MTDNFEWDKGKHQRNQKKHGVDFYEAQRAFLDPNRIIYQDVGHSTSEETRYYCLGMVDSRVLTVRFTYRKQVIRIFGAGYWRKERKLYERTNRKS